MSDGTYKMIKNVEIGDKVITFDPITMYPSVTKVINQYVKSTENKIYKITTISGRQITATEEHKFMTNQGWKEIREFDNDTCVGINVYSEPINNECENFEIIDKYKFKDIMFDYNYNASQIDVFIDKLEELNLLPLYSNHKLINIISRLSGLLLSKINDKYFDVSFESEFSANMFEDDINLLGFDKSEIVKEVNDTTGETLYTVHHEGTIVTLFITIGIKPETEMEYCKIPEWVINGSLMMKREFLTGCQCDSKCQINSPKNLLYVKEITYKLFMFAQSLESFMTQMKGLYDDLEINTKIKNREDTENTGDSSSFEYNDKQVA